MQLVLDFHSTRNSIGNSYLPWNLENIKYPYKYFKRQIKRQFKSLNNNICGKTKVYVYENKNKLTPIEKYIKHTKSLDKSLFNQKLWRNRVRRNNKVKKPWLGALTGAKARAKKKNILFDLDAAWAEETYTGCCYLTGIPFNFIDGKLNSKSASIDKINSKLGYIKENCRWVLFCINALKGSMEDVEMLEIASALLNTVNPKK